MSLFIGPFFLVYSGRPRRGASLAAHSQECGAFLNWVLAYYHIVLLMLRIPEVICQFYLTDLANNLIMAVLY